MMDIAAKYDRNTFIDFLSNNFLPGDFQRQDNDAIDNVGSKIKRAERLGYCESLDLSIYEFKHESLNDPRVTLSRESFKIIEKNDTASNALAVFYSDAANWRLSLITSGYSLDKTNKQAKRDFSNPRRYSYLLGEGCKKHTPESMLVHKDNPVKTEKELKDRFAIEVVTKEFYQRLFDWYDNWAVKTVKFPVGEGVAARLPEKPDVVANRQPLIRLITRLIFVWFLKQKNTLVPEWMFKENDIAEVLKTFDPHSKNEGGYYNGIIQNLFFATLNNEIGKRNFTNDANSREHYGIKTLYRNHKDRSLFKITQEEFIRRFEVVPFLNGGLFECLDRRSDKKQKYVDGFSRESKRAAFVPNCLFFGDGEREGMIELFNRYNFTVEENTPQDIDIALDPELLGKVFENLLGTYNEETVGTARKESGSFYTPREIVEYMVDSSLKEYFKGKLESSGGGSLPHAPAAADAASSATPSPRGSAPKTPPPAYDESTGLGKRLDALFSYSEEGHDFPQDEVTSLIDAIYHCKILDPACGSGAFPMGILNKLVFILEKLDPENKQWKEIQIQKAIKETEEAYRTGGAEERKERLRKIQEIFEQSTGQYANYARKLYLIENCIYGVDIQPIAIQISKLRFFISLIVDQKTGGTTENNYNVRPLPNLETKFIAANTLIGVKQIRDQGIFADPKIEETQKKLLEVRHRHFSPRTVKEKDELRKKDVVLSKALAELLKKDGFYNSSDAQRMADWNPYDQTESTDFFDPYWMFGIKDGFDMVIGNPPYGAGVSEKEKRYFLQNYESAKTIKGKQKGSTDTFALFIEKGHDLCIVNGNVQFIVPIAITSSDSMTGLHALLEKTCSIIRISSYAVRPQPIFQNAVVNTSILFFKKDDKECKHIFTTKMYRKNCHFNLQYLLGNLEFIDIKNFKLNGRYPKISLDIEKQMLEKIFSLPTRIGSLIKKSGKPIFYRTSGGRYFKVITNYSTGSTKEKTICFDEKIVDVLGAILSSNLYFWFYQIFSNNLDLKFYEIEVFPVPLERMSEDTSKAIEVAYSLYLTDIEKYANIRNTEKYANINTFKEYKIRKSKHLIDCIDDLICPLYGLTKSETEFIKNYEIEFRVDG
jgi:type I restriction-modification system DNA methylase subunit